MTSSGCSICPKPPHHAGNDYAITMQRLMFICNKAGRNVLVVEGDERRDDRRLE